MKISINLKSVSIVTIAILAFLFIAKWILECYIGFIVSEEYLNPQIKSGTLSDWISATADSLSAILAGLVLLASLIAIYFTHTTNEIAKKSSIDAKLASAQTAKHERIFSMIKLLLESANESIRTFIEIDKKRSIGSPFNAALAFSSYSLFATKVRQATQFIEQIEPEHRKEFVDYANAFTTGDSAIEIQQYYFLNGSVQSIYSVGGGAKASWIEIWQQINDARAVLYDYLPIQKEVAETLNIINNMHQ